MGITGRQGSWKTKFGGWGGVGLVVLLGAWCQQIAQDQAWQWVGRWQLCVKKGVWVKGKLNSAKPLAIITWLVLVVMGGEGKFSVLGFGSL